MNVSRQIGSFPCVAAMLLAPGTLHSPPKKPSAPVCDRAAFLAVVDVGHTAESPGATSARGVKEYEFNLRLAREIEQKLIAAGFGKTMLLVTEGPAMKGLVKRVTVANNSDADLFLSIHHDSVPEYLLEKWEHEGQERKFSDRFKGHSIFISKNNAEFSASLAFGKLLGNQLKARGLQYTPHYTEAIMRNRRRELVDATAGVYRYDKLIVLRTTRMPAVLFEAGSIVNREEELLLGTPRAPGADHRGGGRGGRGFLRAAAAARSGSDRAPGARPMSRSVRLGSRGDPAPDLDPGCCPRRACRRASSICAISTRPSPRTCATPAPTTSSGGRCPAMTPPNACCGATRRGAQAGPGGPRAVRPRAQGL